MATKTKAKTVVLYIPYWSSLAMCTYSSLNLTMDKYFKFFKCLCSCIIASTLAMCVVQTLLLSDVFYLYCLGFGDVITSTPSMVRLFLSFTKYVHVRQRDKARWIAEIDRSVKERRALSMAFFCSNLICLLIISIAMLGSTRQIIAVAVAFVSHKWYRITN